MIQLGHAGRKASTIAPWLTGGVATQELNGWPDDMYAPSAIRWNEKHAPVKEMSLQDIEDFKAAFATAVKRALKAGFDCVEIHNAYGVECLRPIKSLRRLLTCAPSLLVPSPFIPLTRFEPEEG